MSSKIQLRFRNVVDSFPSWLTVVPALAQLNPLQDRSLPLVLSWQACIAWSFSVAFFGVFLAVPLRRQVIVKEQLTFPSGTATAQIIGVLHNKPLHLGNSTEGDDRVRRRTTRGGGSEYQPLRAGDIAEDEIEGMSRDGKDKKIIDTKAWTALTTSFVISASYTVSSLSSSFFSLLGSQIPPSFSFYPSRFLSSMPSQSSISDFMLLTIGFGGEHPYSFFFPNLTPELKTDLSFLFHCNVGLHRVLLTSVKVSLWDFPRLQA